MIIFKAFQGLENFYVKFQDFPYFSSICTNPGINTETKATDFSWKHRLAPTDLEKCHTVTTPETMQITEE